MTTGLELYEALKPTVGEEAARMIAEALPMTDKIATKSDVDGLGAATKANVDAYRAATKADMDAYRAETKADMEAHRAETKADMDAYRAETKADIEALGLRMEARIAVSEARTFRWMLGFFATLWLGNVGVIVTLVLKI